MTPPALRPVVMGRRGAVCANHPLATASGIDVLKSGGNAFDAAVAVAATIAVVEPAMNGVGGDGFFLLYDARRGRAVTVHAASPTAAAATAERYADGIPYAGVLAAMPPGAVAGWDHINRVYGTRPMAELFGPAVHYAREGFAVTRRLRRDIDDLVAQLAKDRGCAATYLDAGKALPVGATLRNPALALTLETIARDGAGALFGGAVGEKLARFVAGNHGIITLEDLAAHEAEEIAPLETGYHGLKVLESDRPTMGFALLTELAIAENLDIRNLEHLSADHVHLLLECKRLAFVERERHAADPRFLQTPIAPVIGKELGRRLAESIDPTAAAKLEAQPSREADTTYFCVVDGDGNAVSGIQSLAAPFGACAMDPETGILLNNRMTWFHLEPDHPNVLAPKKRVRNTINTPMALGDSGVRCVFGTPGGDSQVQVSLQILSAVFDHGLDPQQAVEAPRWVHFQEGTGSYFPHLDMEMLLLESRFSPDVVEDVESRGHRVTVVGPYDGQGAASMILRDESGLLSCGSDPRRDCWGAAF